MENYEGMIVLYGGLFEFDSPRKNIFEHGHPVNSVRIDDLHVEGKNRIIYCHPKTKALLSKTDLAALGSQRNICPALCVPADVLYRGPELSAAEISAYNDRSLAVRHGYYYVDNDLSDRLNSAYAPIHMDGIDYLLNIEKRIIKQKDNPHIYFQFNEQAVQNGQIKLYNTWLKRPVNDVGPTCRPNAHTVELQFPPLNELDHIGYMKSVGNSPYCLIDTLPWKADPCTIKVNSPRHLFESSINEFRNDELKKLERKLKKLMRGLTS